MIAQLFKCFFYPPQPQPPLPPQPPDPQAAVVVGILFNSSCTCWLAVSSVIINVPRNIPILQLQLIVPIFSGVNSIICSPCLILKFKFKSGTTTALLHPVSSLPLIIHLTGIPFCKTNLFGFQPLLVTSILIS